MARTGILTSTNFQNQLDYLREGALRFPCTKRNLVQLPFVFKMVIGCRCSRFFHHSREYPSVWRSKKFEDLRQILLWVGVDSLRLWTSTRIWKLFLTSIAVLGAFISIFVSSPPAKDKRIQLFCCTISQFHGNKLSFLANEQGSQWTGGLVPTYVFYLHAW